jgi:hypothetical protein
MPPSGNRPFSDPNAAKSISNEIYPPCQTLNKNSGGRIRRQQCARVSVFKISRFKTYSGAAVLLLFNYFPKC